MWQGLLSSLKARYSLSYHPCEDRHITRAHWQVTYDGISQYPAVSRVNRLDTHYAFIGRLLGSDLRCNRVFLHVRARSCL